MNFKLGLVENRQKSHRFKPIYIFFSRKPDFDAVRESKIDFAKGTEPEPRDHVHGQSHPNIANSYSITVFTLETVMKMMIKIRI